MVGVRTDPPAAAWISPPLKETIEFLAVRLINFAMSVLYGFQLHTHTLKAGMHTTVGALIGVLDAVGIRVGVEV